MKKTVTKTIIALAITLFTTNAYAQNFYAKLNAGYNWDIASDAPRIGGDNTTSGGSGTSYEKVNLSLGKGINLCGAVGYMFNKNIGAELGFNYLVGGTTEFASKSSNPNNPNNYSNNKSILSATLFSFIPTIVITTDYEQINPYAKIGFSVGSATVTRKNEDVSSNGGITNVLNQTTLINGGIALGLVSAVGVNYKMNDKISLFGELNISSLRYRPSKSEVTESNINGVNNLSDLKTRDKITEYADSYSEDSANSNPDAASKEITPNIPLSNIGLNIGIKYNF